MLAANSWPIPPSLTLSVLLFWPSLSRRATDEPGPGPGPHLLHGAFRAPTLTGAVGPGSGKRPDLLLENMDVLVFLSTDEGGVNVF